MSMARTESEFEEITRRVYEVVSAPADKRNWESIREFYHPRATMVRTGVDQPHRGGRQAV